MDKFTAVEIDASTGIITEREFSQDEIELHNQINLEMQEVKDSQSAIRDSALAKLAALGLTEEEIAAL